MGKITKGSGNMYADLGTAEAEEMLVKAQLAAKISEIIKLRKLTQTQASSLLGIPQPISMRRWMKGTGNCSCLHCGI